MRSLLLLLLLSFGCARTQQVTQCPTTPLPESLRDRAAGGQAHLVSRPVSDGLTVLHAPANESNAQSDASQVSRNQHSQVEVTDVDVDEGLQKLDDGLPTPREMVPVSHQSTEPVNSVAFIESTIPEASELAEPAELTTPEVTTADEPMPADEPAISANRSPEQDAELLIPPATSESMRLELNHVIHSVYQAYPSLEAALQQRGIVLGQQLTAQGAFDTKFKGASENTAEGFYENYRNSLGLVQPLYQGGEIFAGYRIGRGNFEPWYKERQTNEGGEFKAGFVMPLAQNRTIDERRADLWKTQFERQVVEADIQAQLIDFVQRASIVYWEWVAAGEGYRVAERILQLANNRSERIRSQVDSGLLDPPELTDNLRLIAERRVKLAQSSEKLQKAAIKLSLYYRSFEGFPIIPDPSQLPEFPEPTPVNPADLETDIQIALQQRPELVIYDLIRRQLDVDYAQASNQLMPEVDAVVTASKDMGEPTSKKNDKGPLNLEASVFVDVPLQRRKARGKVQSVQSKVMQVAAKRRLAENKIATDVQSAYASLTTSYVQVEQARQAVEFAEELAQRERTNFEAGSSDLLKVTLREQYAVESQQKEIDALLDYFTSQTNYRAALAHDRLEN